MRPLKLWICVVCLGLALCPDLAAAEQKQEVYQKRQEMFREMEQYSHIPWYYLAAIDQYERAIGSVRQDIPDREGLIAIYIPPHHWAGPLNPNPNDMHPFTIQLFGGLGRDGDGDGLADPNNDRDVLFSFVQYLMHYGLTDDDILTGLWEYYGSDAPVRHIYAFSRIYKAFGHLDLLHYTFPLPPGYNRTYRDTWGDARGWGGRRMHEGTDIFAAYGTPVRSTCYGYVEVVGWNDYGGWRVGIRDLKNVYHYYAHLSGFAKGLKEGQVVKPGDIIGYVGSSGYGKPGTQGKFPPHLHYGMYKHNGRNEWAFDPYPSLRAWELSDRRNSR